MKEYVLKIGYDPITEEVIYVKEYIEGSKATLHIDNKEIELDDELANYVVKDEIGIT